MIIYSLDLLASVWGVLSEVHAAAHEWSQAGKLINPLQWHSQVKSLLHVFSNQKGENKMNGFEPQPMGGLGLVQGKSYGSFGPSGAKAS